MEMFLDCLNKQLREKIQNERDLPVNVQQAMKAAVRIDNQWRDREEEKKKNAEWSWRDRRAPRVQFRPRWSFLPTDPNAMDVDSMTVEERAELLRKGACFFCKQTGHMARTCPKRTKKTTFSQTTGQSTTGKPVQVSASKIEKVIEEDRAGNTFAKIRAIADQLSAEDYKKMVKLSAKAGGF